MQFTAAAIGSSRDPLWNESRDNPRAFTVNCIMQYSRGYESPGLEQVQQTSNKHECRLIITGAGTENTAEGSTMASMSAVNLVAAPLSVAGLPFALGLRVLSLSVLVWWRSVRALFNLHTRLCVSFVVFLIALFTFPIRVLTALDRETKLERIVMQMQGHVERLMFEKDQLEERLQLAQKDRRFAEKIFDEIEEEHEKALSTIDLLQNELYELKEENRRLEYRQEHIKPDESPQKRNKKTVRNKVSDNNETEIERRERVEALYRSLFSSILSLVVGMVVWEAHNPCTPLVVALFFVVGMSLHSVVAFFSTLKNKPATDAVALLCLNCFILGTLSSPMLPRLPYFLAHRIFLFLGYPK